jgi:VWFA-related protein
MRALALVPFLLTAASLAQTTPTPAPDQAPYVLRSTTNLVLVPTQVQTKKGDILYGLKREQFVLEDNGIPQTIRLDEDTDLLGLSLVVVVQCSRETFRQFDNMRGLASMVDSLVGGAPSRVAVVQYGSEPELLGGFTPNPDHLAAALAKVQPCEDGGAATLDAVNYANTLFDSSQKTAALTGNRRAILLIGETRDHGSRMKPEAVIANLGRTNTVVDAVSFNPGKTSVLDSLIHGQYGPGPMGLILSAVQALRKNVPRTLAALTGGEYTNFTTQKGFDNGIGRLANHIHNYYLLSYTPAGSTTPGLHKITVRIPDYPDAEIRSRLTWYAGEAPPPEIPETKEEQKEDKKP